jgi:hypothetical protein
MKKILLLSTMSILATASYAWRAGDGVKKNTLEIQGKGSANSTFLFNNNISDAGDDQNYAAGWGFNYGLGVSMYFGNVGFGVEGLMGNHRGAYAGDIKNIATGTVTEYTSSVNLEVIQIPVFFKLKSDIGAYLEVGPQYNMISKATYQFSAGGVETGSIMTDDYAKTYFSAVLGVGFNIPIAKSNFSVLAGLRLQYSFTDIEGVDARGRSFDNLFVYTDPQSTSAASAGLMLGVVYTLGNKKADK